MLKLHCNITYVSKPFGSDEIMFCKYISGLQENGMRKNMNF
jgi:hypothetical protein